MVKRRHSELSIGSPAAREARREVCRGAREWTSGL